MPHSCSPGDLLFFGTAHFNSRATEQNVIHTGIYLGDNWVIHSSGQGVYVRAARGQLARRLVRLGPARDSLGRVG